jgi:phosphotransferase system enzyme I (PtsP)
MSDSTGEGAWGNGASTLAPERRKDRRSNISSRRLIARLRDIMAGEGGAEERLDKIVALIAAELVAEVCSCYVMRAGEVLELFATVGLNRAAIHNTRLRTGEGLVGTIAAQAQPLSLADAPSHPNFAYRPETGEDPYHSLAGVPILRGGRVRGVLVIQNRSERSYTPDEIDTLQTVAMVVAELVAGGELVDPRELSTSGDASVMQQRLSGLGMNGGLALGLAVLHRPQLTLHQIVAEDPAAEEIRLDGALQSMRQEIDTMLVTSGLIGSGEHIEILETYRLFADDRGWLSRIVDAIGQGLTAEAAVAQVQNGNRARLAQIADPYLRERLLDLEDLSMRLLKHLSTDGRFEKPEMPDNFILVARALGPAELLDYDRAKLRGVLLEEGSTSSHVSIVARALGIPLVGHCADALTRVEPADMLILDGDTGQVNVRPSEDLIAGFYRTLALRKARKGVYREARNLPSVTLDGVQISLNINAGLLIEMPQLHDVQADSVGLYRTEIPFMVRAEYPDMKTQVELYREVLNAAGGKPVTFRTLDVGGDKPLPSFAVPTEENPALGWRAIRIGLDRPAMLRTQLRALISAAQGRDLRLMFPLVAEVAELDRARELLGREMRRAQDRDEAPASLKVGVMIEVPSLLWQLDALLRDIDFVSVGSNDLMQYLFAADRNNARVNKRYDPLSPPLLNALSYLNEKCRAARVPLSVCGDMASRPLDAMALVGLGIESLSMPASAIGPVKAMVRSLEMNRISDYLGQVIKSRDHSLRDKLRAFAHDHKIAVEENIG